MLVVPFLSSLTLAALRDSPLNHRDVSFDSRECRSSLRILLDDVPSPLLQQRKNSLTYIARALHLQPVNRLHEFRGSRQKARVACPPHCGYDLTSSSHDWGLCEFGVEDFDLATADGFFAEGAFAG